jgi:hypothetical protein
MMRELTGKVIDLLEDSSLEAIKVSYTELYPGVASDTL